MITSRRHPLFFFFGNPTGQAPSSTQATAGPRHIRRTHRHVIRHRLTGHKTTHNAKPTAKRARRTRAHDERRHVPHNPHDPTQARRTNISRVRHATNTRAIVFITTTATRESFFTQTQLYTRDTHECVTARKHVTHDAYDSAQTRHINISRARRSTKTRAKPEAPPHDNRFHTNTRGHANKSARSAKKTARHDVFDPVPTHDRASTHTRHETKTTQTQQRTNEHTSR